MLRREPLGNTLIFAHNKFAIPISNVPQKEELPKHSEVQIATAIPTSVGLRVPLNLGHQEKKEMGKRFRDISVSFQKKITMCKQASKLKVFGIQTKYISNSVKTSLLEKKHYVVGILHKRTYSLLKKIGLIISVGIHEIIRKILVYINGLLKDVIYTSRSKIEVLLKIIQGEE